MSDVYLWLGLVAAFAAVAVSSWAVAVARAQRRNGTYVLERQVGSVAATVNLREQELQASLLERVVLPVLSRVSSRVNRFTPVSIQEGLRRKLVLAGSPGRWDVEKVATLKMIGVGVSIVALVILMFSGFSGRGLQLFFFVGLLAFVGFYAVDAVLARKARERQEAIQNALPDTIDLLTINVEAGLSLDASLAQVTEHVQGPLSEEIGRMLQEMRLGVARVEAFRHLADRTDVDELRSFVVAMIQADTFGVSVANVLRAQSKEQRTKRRQRAEEKAMRVPIKILFPLVFCVMPALFVVILGPGAIRMWQSFLGG